MPLELILAPLAGIYGLIVGSFLNVLIYRVPAGRTILGRSHCPNCDYQIKWFDNIPVFSWLILGAKCRNCRAAISARYPLVEAFTALTWTLAALTLNTTILLPLYLIAIAVSITLAMIDYDTMRLPDPLVITLTALIVLLVAGETFMAGDFDVALKSLISALALGGFYFLIWLVTLGRGMGFGDVKLAPSLGALMGLFGYPSVLIGAFVAWMIGGAVVIVGWAMGRVKRGKHVPFGPFLLGGAWIGVFWGVPLATWYLGLFGLA